MNISTRNYEGCETDVLAAIGRAALYEMQGKPEQLAALFQALAPQFKNRYPYLKILTDLCCQAGEPKAIDSLGPESPSDLSFNPGA